MFRPELGAIEDRCWYRRGRITKQEQSRPKAISANLVILSLNGLGLWDGLDSGSKKRPVGELAEEYDVRPEDTLYFDICVVFRSCQDDGLYQAEDTGEASSGRSSAGASIPLNPLQAGNTYKSPVPNRALTPTFLLCDIRRFQLKYTGTLSIAMSEIILNTADARYKMLALRQCPGASGFQILSRGLQRKMGMMKKRT